MSLRAAIDAKCRDCIHDKEAPGTWRAQVAGCPCIRCPLWPVRPAPKDGPLADCPRDPAQVTAEWLRARVGGPELTPKREQPVTPGLPTSSDSYVQE